MKNNKFKVVIYENENIKSEKEYKSYKEICKELNIEYHQAQEINKRCENLVNRKFTHPHTAELLKTVKIYNIPLNRF